MSLKFRGLGVAMVTPFDERGNIDFGSLSNLVEHLITGNASYIVLLGTTAESVVLSEIEKDELVRFVVKQVKGRLPLVMGVGGNNTSAIKDTLKTFDFSGIDGILSVTPYYNKPTQKGLELHYKAIAAQTDLPIILYNVPGRTGVNMTAETTLKLASEVLNIVAVKEASGNINQQSYILRDRPEDFLVLSGDDGLAMPQMAMGFDGVISVVGNAFPKPFSEMIDYAQQGKLQEAQEIHLKLIEIIDNLFVEGNPAGVKAVLSMMGIVKNVLRLPLAPISDRTFAKLEQLIKDI
ncbi:MAG: 4-hydroxy-tetrahydrodipicolinate synthase [Bacteroidales bacterium]|jgi:4-hydroxy-tetrahydrodipicolinate synthase|nr:4-hydroxy-tetrahydrodipicolinate synthase [Bacteroidales bacterium]MDD4384218.1 4-hydroxy-tetrahydrodipicolinate synthase [Bacteroidales bacterium]MDY0197511.1 4-hydroxy-tetrahydrodipicolinate synthase [Tenuifilaceae bacterium]